MDDDDYGDFLDDLKDNDASLPISDDDSPLDGDGNSEFNLNEPH